MPQESVKPQSAAPGEQEAQRRDEVQQRHLLCRRFAEERVVGVGDERLPEGVHVLAPDVEPRRRPMAAEAHKLIGRGGQPGVQVECRDAPAP